VNKPTLSICSSSGSISSTLCWTYSAILKAIVGACSLLILMVVLVYPPILYNIPGLASFLLSWSDFHSSVDSMLSTLERVAKAITNISCSSALDHFKLLNVLLMIWVPNCRGIF
jgi:hypothetical protein